MSVLRERSGARADPHPARDRVRAQRPDRRAADRGHPRDVGRRRLGARLGRLRRPARSAAGSSSASLVGYGGAWIAERAHLGGAGLFAVLASGLAGLAYGAATQVGGSGLLAVYLVGLAARAPAAPPPPRAAHGARGVRLRRADDPVPPARAPGVPLRPARRRRRGVRPRGRPRARRPPARGPRRAPVVRPRPAASSPSSRGRASAARVPIVLATFPLTAGYPDARARVRPRVLRRARVRGGAGLHDRARWRGGSASPPTACPPRATVMGLDHVARRRHRARRSSQRAGVVGRPLREVPMPAGIRVSVLERGDAHDRARRRPPSSSPPTSWSSSPTRRSRAAAALERWVLGPARRAMTGST